MLTIPIEIQLLFAGLLFFLGLVGVLVRRNIFFIMMSIEIMLNSAGLVFIIASAHWKHPGGQVMFIFILAVAAAEVSIGLALILRVFHHYKSLDVEAVNELKDEVKE
ncbi:MAG: NADH-quinone oxidoreductase subunit NuoK [Bacteroidales bacterium]|nr:NADH-quinone oxidoreductase subunit NuoK [Bacteroidales bacterium]